MQPQLGTAIINRSHRDHPSKTMIQEANFLPSSIVPDSKERVGMQDLFLFVRFYVYQPFRREFSTTLTIQKINIDSVHSLTASETG
jgi:hypothetical protein